MKSLYFVSIKGSTQYHRKTPFFKEGCQDGILKKQKTGFTLL